MPELNRQGMLKATLAAIAAKDQPHWSQADMVRAAIEAYVAEVYPTGGARCASRLVSLLRSSRTKPRAGVPSGSVVMYGRVKGGRVWHLLISGRFTVGTVCGRTVIQTSDLPKSELCRECWRIRERSFAHQHDSVVGQEPDEHGY